MKLQNGHYEHPNVEAPARCSHAENVQWRRDVAIPEVMFAGIKVSS